MKFVDDDDDEYKYNVLRSLLETIDCVNTQWNWWATHNHFFYTTGTEPRDTAAHWLNI